MLKATFKRYWNPIFNIILVIACLPPIALATWINYGEYLEFAERAYSLTVATDIARNQMIADSFTGISYFERLFYLNTDYLSIFWIIMMIGMGIHIGGSTFSVLKSGYGTMIMTRMKYSKYVRDIFLAQLFYLLTFMALVFAIIFFGLMVFAGGSLEPTFISRMTDISTYNMTTIQYVMILKGVVLYTMICMIPLVFISTFSTAIFKSKYAVQFVPVAILLGGYVFGFMFGNINDTMSYIMRQFIFEHALTMLTGFISPWAETYSTDLLFIILYPAMLFILAFVLYKKNIAKLGTDFIL